MFSTPAARQAELTHSESITCGPHCEDKHPEHSPDPGNDHAVVHRHGCTREEQTSKQSSNPMVFNPYVKKLLQGHRKSRRTGQIIHIPQKRRAHISWSNSSANSAFPSGNGTSTVCEAGYSHLQSSVLALVL